MTCRSVGLILCQIGTAVYGVRFSDRCRECALYTRSSACGRAHEPCPASETGAVVDVQ